ncbi:Splicing factor 3B subunit 4, partial [Cucurbita argyrosperma subsp. argyrosperma]
MARTERTDSHFAYVADLESRSVLFFLYVLFLPASSINSCSNLPALRVSEESLWELFVQAGPVVNVYVPKDRVTNLHQGYGFIEFRSEEDADYDVDEKLLYDTFSAFGVIVTNPKIMRDPDTGNSRGFGFISYDSFEASDAAIEAMNGQYLCNRQITVSYAYKKDTKGERHGTPAERVLAASNPQKSRPHTLFASGPPTLPKVAQPNASFGAPVPPRPFANGAMAPSPIPAIRPPPPQRVAFPPMQMVGQPQAWQGQPQQQAQMMPGSFMLPPVQQFRPPPPNMPPPPPQAPTHSMPVPPPMGMGTQPQLRRPPPPPMQQQLGMPPMQMSSMPLPPPPNHIPPPLPSSG